MVSHRVEIVAWGQKHGSPPAANFLFDLRSIRNPFRRPDLREMNGLHPEVIADIFEGNSHAAIHARLWLATITKMLIDHISAVDKPVRVVFMCTGGRHRSVAFARQVANRIRASFAWCELVESYPHNEVE